MKIYRFISTVRAKDPQGNKPTHYLSARENQGDQNGELVASLWSKTIEKDGVKKSWLSGEMKGEYKDHTEPTKSRKGYVIVEEAELNELIKNSTKPVLVEEDIIDESEIPF